MKKLFLIVALIMTLLCSTYSFAIDSIYAEGFINKNVEVGIYLRDSGYFETVIIKGKLLNVINGADLYSNMFAMFSYYVILKLENREKVVTIPCKYITYITEK